MSALRTPTDSLLAHQTVAQVMHRGVISCAGQSPVGVVAATMATHGIHAAAILPPEGDRALAVSDLDVLRAALRGGDATTAADIAGEPMPTIAPGAPLASAVALMARRDVAHLLVSAEPDAEWPAGVLSSFDIVSVLAGRDPALMRLIRPAPARPLVSATDLSATTVGAVMHPGVVQCPPAARLEVLAGTMADLRLHCVAVAGVAAGDRDEHFVWGIVSDMDIVHAAYGGELGTPAGDVAATAPLALAESSPLHRAATLMSEHDATHVIAIGRSGLPSGVVSTLDVLRIVAAG